MSILIKGMEMPENCGECGLNYDDMHCRALMQSIEDINYFCQKLSDCPLIEVPTPHGRLIDADALNNMINQSYPMTDRVDVHNGYAIIQEMMKQLLTIIPAEEGET